MNTDQIDQKTLDIMWKIINDTFMVVMDRHWGNPEDLMNLPEYAKKLKENR